MNSIQISVIMASYNHANYVEATIQSVLCQVGVNFEFLIEDDGSQDLSTDIILKFTDSRVKFFKRNKNIGACSTLNNLISIAKGKYISIINSDDVWINNDKLLKQFYFLEKNDKVIACFGRARYIDQNNLPINKKNIMLGDIFDIPNMDQSKWVKHFFYAGNCLCHPTIMIRREAYKLIGKYDNRLRQIPDFSQWIKLIKYGPIHILDEDVIDFRLIAGENSSAPTFKNSIRLMNEYELVYDKFFDNINKNLFQESFCDLLVIPELPSDAHFEIEKILLYFQPRNWIEGLIRTIGLKKMYNIIDCAEFKNILENDYHIDDLWFQEQMAIFSSHMPQSILNSIQNNKENIIKNNKNIFLQKIPVIRYFIK